MANYKDCIEVIKKAAGDWLSDSQAEKLLSQIDDLAQAKKFSVPLSELNSQVLTDLDNAANSVREAALIEKRNAMINHKIQAQVLEKVGKFKSPYEGIMALLGGKHLPVQGALASIDAQGKAVVEGTLGKIINALQKDDLLEAFTSGSFDREIAKELWELPNGKPGITGVAEAEKIAGIIHQAQNQLVYRQNRAGAFIRLLPGYIVRQSHDLFKIREAGYETWAAKVFPLIDAQKTFGTLDANEFLKEAYDSLSSGLHYKVRGEQTVDSSFTFGFKGPGNLAKKISEERILHFKDADSWFQYNQAFGHDNLRDSLLGGIEHAGRNIALMENLGTNPRAMLDDIVQQLRLKYKDQPKVVDSLKGYNIFKLYDQLDGTAHIPVYHKVAAVASGVRMLQNMAKLGAAVLSSVTDIPFQAAALRHNGVGLLESYGNAFQNIIRGRGNAEQKEIARLIGVGFEGMLKDIANRFSSEDTLPGFMAKLQHKYFTLNGMNWWNDSHKTGVALMLSNHLAEQSNVAFDKLPGQLKRVLTQYNISESEWNLVKDLTSTAEDGHKYFSPDAVHNLPDERVIQAYGFDKTNEIPVNSRNLRETRDALETKWRTYFIDQINHAVPHPGAVEHSYALLGGGTQPGTVLGEAMRFIGQFKSFPITVVRKGIAPHIYQTEDTLWNNVGKGRADYTGLVHLMVATTVFGYLAGVAKDTARGLTPKDPNNPKTWVAAMAQGGGLGLYGDFLFGEFNKYGHSAIASMSGPTLSNAEDLMRLYSKARDGDKIAGQMMRTAINNVPFANLFYTRMAMDYLFLYQLQESVNPGYLSRLEGRIMKDNHQQFYIPPTSTIPYGGGDRFMEGVR